MSDPVEGGYPELFFGVAGPIGVDIDTIQEVLQSALRGVGYKSRVIKITTEMLRGRRELAIRGPRDFYTDTKWKIETADRICLDRRDTSAMARIAIASVSETRHSLTGDREKTSLNTAYIIRQLKRPDEVSLLRKLYGRLFILVSAYGPASNRREFLFSKMKRTMSTRTSDSDIYSKADELIDLDLRETTKPYGQNVRDTFPQGDVIIDGMSRMDMTPMVTRFIEALFGRNDISPSKIEYGMYAAKSASLRSADLSRQVGAAIFSAEGDIITQGCNEAPRAFGGTYWDMEEPDFRDIRVGHDPNEELKNHILRDLVERLLDKQWFSPEAAELGSAAVIVERLTTKATIADMPDGAWVGADILDLTEYGRVVHAEMCAICDAARLGKSVKRGILFCTTFPCHNCTKHIIPAGISKVIYLEPYPKSKAKLLHAKEIELEATSETRVAFLPFLGISPFRYRDIFQKSRRKDASGNARRWYHGGPRPMVDVVSAPYLDEESFIVAEQFSEIHSEQDK